MIFWLSWPNTNPPLGPEPMVSHSYLAVLGSAFLILIGMLLLLWSWIRIKIRIPQMPVNIVSEQNGAGKDFIIGYLRRLEALPNDLEYLSLPVNAQKQFLIQLLDDFICGYYRRTQNLNPQQAPEALEKQWPELQWVRSNLQTVQPYPGLERQVNTWLIPILNNRGRWHSWQYLIPSAKVRKWYWVWLISVPLSLILFTVGTLQGINVWHSYNITKYLEASNLSAAQKQVDQQNQRALVSESWVDTYNLGTAYLQEGQLDQAEKYLQQASEDMVTMMQYVQKEPGNYYLGCQVRYNYAYVLYEKTSQGLIEGNTYRQLSEDSQYSKILDVTSTLSECTTWGLAVQETGWESYGIEYYDSPIREEMRKLAGKSDVLVQAFMFQT